ncbi:MAG: hypothetical protein QME66_08220 [Candidatus Eisenbacteria bacterium]|nr:hypothetical protein [Candidatus Eisenbacteria bacterium]
MVPNRMAQDPPPKRTIAETVFDMVLGTIITLVVLIGLKLIVPRAPRK